MTQATKAYTLTVITILIWSTVATAFKLALQELNPIQLLLIAQISSTCSFWAVIIIQKKLKTLFEVPKKQFLFCLFLGLINPLCYYLLLVEGYSLLPAQIAQPINCSWAITLSLLSIPFLGQKLQLRDAISLCIGYGGVVIIATGGSLEKFSDVNGFGLFVLLLSTLFWCAYWIINTRSKLEPIMSLTISFSASLPLTFLVYLLFSEPIDFTKMEAIFYAVYLGLFEMGITFLLWLMALKLAPAAAKLNIMILFVPFLSLFWISLILGEQIATATLVGLSCIVFSGVIQCLKKT